MTMPLHSVRSQRASLAFPILAVLAACDAEPLGGPGLGDTAAADPAPAFDLPPEHAPPPPIFSISGSCPGPVTFTVTNATPLGQVRLAWSPVSGPGVVGSGVCAGTQVKLLPPITVSPGYTANGSGVVTVPATLPPAVCGYSAMAMDLTTCSPSNLIIL